jgi:hypothetical protein
MIGDRGYFLAYFFVLLGKESVRGLVLVPVMIIDVRLLAAVAAVHLGRQRRRPARVMGGAAGSSRYRMH